MNDNINMDVGSVNVPGNGSVSTIARPMWLQRRLVSLVIIVGLGFALYLPGIYWGLPALTSWSQDTIAGARSLGPVEGWPKEWRGRYPPLHYLINVALYQPIHLWWERSGQRFEDPQTGRMTLTPPQVPKVGFRILLSRVLTLIMAITAGLGIWAATMALTKDSLAALLAAVTVMIGAAFTYFAHLGNVDIPSICWFAWSVFFFVRAIQSEEMRHCFLLGLFAALSVCTKDGLAGVYPGMALVLLAEETRRQRSVRDGPTSLAGWANAFWSALLQPRWLVGLAAFVLPYLVISGVLYNPGGYAARMAYWLDDSRNTLHAAQYRYPDQFRLLLATGWYAAGAVGWPMLAAMICAVIYNLVRHTRIALTVLAPALTYYVVVIACVLHFVYSRFLFPPLALVAILTGLAGSALMRDRVKPLWVRLGIPTVVLLVSLGYALGVNVEMWTDSRYSAESWFRRHVDPPSSVGVFSKGQYLPRLLELGYQVRPGVMARRTFDRPGLPEYLVLTSYNYEDFDSEQTACLADLLAGELGYGAVADFGGWRYLGTGSSWLSLAGWGALPPGKISPRTIVLQRDTARQPSPPQAAETRK